MPVVDLFCGCGGLSKGFEQAGFNIVAAYDGWQSAITCYNTNFAHKAKQLDLSNVAAAANTILPFAPNIIIGGPPCQDFSNAGKREEGTLADLTFSFADIVTRLMPDFFVMENVPRARYSNAYARAKALYIKHGYALTEVVLDASRCGVPQKRNRFFCIGAINATHNFLLDAIFDAYGDDETTVRRYFDEHKIPLEINDFYRHPTTYNRRAIFSVDAASPTIRGVNRPKPQTYNRHNNDSVSEEDLNNIRSLTLRERATIQTFPQNYQFDNLGISNCDLEQMVGNAVPVLLAQFVAERLNEYINEVDSPMNNQQSFSAWLRNERKYTSDRSISDVFSRLRRAKRILPDREINRYFLVDLEQQEEYQALTGSVRSQIKKAINLRIEFDNRVNNHE